MSFSENFEKTADLRNMTDIELQYKANKHITRAIKNDKAALKGAAIGAAIGATAGGAQVARGKWGKLPALGTTLLSSAAASGAGYAWKDYNSRKGFKYAEELGRRGFFPSQSSSSKQINWKPMPRYRS